MPINNSWIPWVQWLAVITMTLDHSARYLQPGNYDYYWVIYTLGRWAFPAFAALLAWHAMHNSRHLGRYLLRILIIALIAQPAYAWMHQESLWDTRLNVCFTLALGLAITALIKQAWQLSQNPIASAQLLTWGGMTGLTLLFSGLLAARVDYGLAGILFTPSLAVMYLAYGQRHNSLSARIIWLTSCLLPLAMVLAVNSGWVPRLHTYLALAVLILLPWLAEKASIWKPPFPRWLWLSWYPLHLFIIGAIARLIA
ncbi:TraX family protein [Marinospirillum perlucidum]|uniref:TraX family protein n=1 Tax=Marinospirillum perlucidum TaxID=1982602 RepID=UPI000DF36084|nr:TraX family protein [Marinospirillum perlucidum]